MRFTETIEVPKPPRQVFGFAADFRKLGRWDPSVERSRLVSPGEPRVGSTFEVTLRFLGIPNTLVYRVEEWDPPRRVVLRAETWAAEVTDRILVEPARGGSRLTWEADIRFRGPLVCLDPLARLGFAPTVEAAVRNLAQALRRLPAPTRVVSLGGRAEASAAGKTKKTKTSPATAGKRKRERTHE